MHELWLNFSDPDGVTRRVRVSGSRFVIGRQPDCDLAISDSRLSRQHVAIESFGGRFEISDLGSSNGTELRGSQVFDAAPIYDGDTISLGGLMVRAEIAEQAQAAASAASVAVAPIPAAKPNKSKVEKKGGIPLALLLAVPIIAVVLVVVAGGVVYLVVARGSAEVTTNIDDTDDPDPISKKDDDPVVKKNDDTPTSSSPTTSGANGDPVNDGPTNGTNTTDVKPANSETAKIEANGAGFLQKIAQKNTNVFLTGDQTQKVGAKVKQFSGSSAIAENIKSAQKNASGISALAAKNSLKPQFLAVAAITKLGGSRGDVLATAQSMSETLGKLRTHIGNEFSDECLLTIAAYDQGVAGETMKMRNMLQQLAVDVSDSSRTIRTIWYLHKNNKITQAEYDRALTFLAIGTIAQNPKAFNVNAEALNL